MLASVLVSALRNAKRARVGLAAQAGLASASVAMSSTKLVRRTWRLGATAARRGGLS